MADPGSLRIAVCARPPRELRTGEQERVVEVARGRGHDPRGTVAPLHANGAVAARQSIARCRRPVRESVLDERGPNEHVVRLAEQRRRTPRIQDRREREDVPDEPVRGSEIALRVAVHVLRPGAVGVLPRQYRICALRARAAPALVAGPLEHESRGDQRSGRTPHDLVRLVADVRPHSRVQRVRKTTAGRKSKRHDEDPGLTREE